VFWGYLFANDLSNIIKIFDVSEILTLRVIADLAGSTATALTFSHAAEVRLIDLGSAVEKGRFPLRKMTIIFRN
jgi:hypothetical protein